MYTNIIKGGIPLKEVFITKQEYYLFNNDEY